MCIGLFPGCGGGRPRLHSIPSVPALDLELCQLGWLIGWRVGMDLVATRQDSCLVALDSHPGACRSPLQSRKLCCLPPAVSEGAWVGWRSWWPCCLRESCDPTGPHGAVLGLGVRWGLETHPWPQSSPFSFPQ